MLSTFFAGPSAPQQQAAAALACPFSLGLGKAKARVLFCSLGFLWTTAGVFFIAIPPLGPPFDDPPVGGAAMRLIALAAGKFFDYTFGLRPRPQTAGRWVELPCGPLPLPPEKNSTTLSACGLDHKQGPIGSNAPAPLGQVAGACLDSCPSPQIPCGGICKGRSPPAIA